MKLAWRWALVAIEIMACRADDAMLVDAEVDAVLDGADDAPAADAATDAAIDARTDAALDAGVVSPFRTVGSLAQARTRHAAALLQDGRVLVVGGDTPDPNDRWTTSAEVFDPVTEKFSPVGSMALIHLHPQATTLTDGRVLVTGPALVPFGLVPKTEIFDPATNSFSAGPDMLAIHGSHVATPLDDGRVLVTDETNEVYNPVTNTFEPIPPLNVLGPGHEALRLANHRVLLSGGPHQGSSGGGTRTDAEEFDPITNTFVVVGSMATPRAAHQLTPLPGGRALATGGYIGLGGEVEVFASAEIYDATTRTFASAGLMTTSREHHTATALLDGRVLVTGGISDGHGTAPDNDFEITATAEVYDPAARTFRATPAPMSIGRAGHTATRLRDGRVLLVGGTPTPIVELYTP